MNDASFPRKEALVAAKQSSHNSNEDSESTAARSEPNAGCLEPDSVPRELRQAEQWLGWIRTGTRGAKVPTCCKTRRKASVTDRSAWTSFECAVAAYENGGLDGIGFVFSEDDEFAGVDLDGCIDSDGTIVKEAQVIIDTLSSYTEVSPSGKGVKIFLRGRVPPGGNRCAILGFRQIEIYDHSRFFTVTGHHLPSTPSSVEVRNEELSNLHRQIFKADRHPQGSVVGPGLVGPLTAQDQELLHRARSARNGAKFSRLYDRGDIGGYGSGSEADAAIACGLAFWCGDDPDRILRLVRHSALDDEKWGREDYAELTIRKAIDYCPEFWTGEGALPKATREWPHLLEAALQGLAGRFVRLVEPHSEADPVALLVQLLVFFGNVIGRTAHFTVEADRHFLNIFGVLVGETSKARKGTSEGHVRRRFEVAEPEWTRKRIETGLSSGEGLIWAVRDPIFKPEPVKKKGVSEGATRRVLQDPGIDDKRLLVIEEEFATVMAVMRRSGNTISQILRRAWDGRDLSTMTKNSPARATAPHISIIGHITTTELLRVLDPTDRANGFGNRFLWLCVRRSKSLPEGGSLDAAALTPVDDDLCRALTFARNAAEITRDEEAKQLWAEVYPSLSEGKPGLLGAMTARAEAQTMRLAALYALLDCSLIIQRQHLEAALALWSYCEASAAYIFGEASGDPLADELLGALRRAPDGLTRTAIRDHFSRHKAAKISSTLAVLEQGGAVRKESRRTGGRDAEVWLAVGGCREG